MKRLISIATLVGLVVLCGAPNSAQAGATVTVIPVQFAGFTCNGEFVVVDGTFQSTTNIHFDKSGGFHLVDNWNIKARGEGDFGNEYLYNWSDGFQVQEGEDSLPFTLTHAHAERLVGKGQAPNLKIQIVQHLTVNANGTVTADVSKFTVTCG